MVSLKRTKEPEELSRTNREFQTAISGMSTKEAYEFYKRNERRYRYNTEEVKEIFRKMNHERCSFCTKRISDFEDKMTVEHMQIKRDYPEEIFKWSNLLCACGICNTKRGVAPYEKENYLDPTKEPDIERYFSYKMDGNMIPNGELDPQERQKADYMIKLYKLHRRELVCERRAFLHDLMEDDDYFEILCKKSDSSQSIIFLSVFKNYMRTQRGENF